MLEVSNFALSTFRTCPKRWYWNYIEQLKPRKQHASLTLGSIIHEAFDRYYKGETIGDVCQWISDEYRSKMGELPPEEQEHMYLDSKTALGMFLNFPFQQMKFDEIQSEREFELPLMKDVNFKGRIDGKVKYKGQWWVREVKTTGETKTMFENRASVSAQASGYVWAIETIDKDAVVGLIYDYIRKPRLYKKSSEDMYEYGQRIYLDYCDSSKRETYFHRYQTYRTPQDLDMWLSDARSTSKQIQGCIAANEYPRNTGSCWVFNQECPYRRICFEMKPDPMVLELLYDKEDRDARKEGSKEDSGSAISSGTGGNADVSGQ